MNSETSTWQSRSSEYRSEKSDVHDAFFKKKKKTGF